jgi:hypothetical protein
MSLISGQPATSTTIRLAPGQVVRLEDVLRQNFERLETREMIGAYVLVTVGRVGLQFIGSDRPAKELKVLDEEEFPTWAVTQTVEFTHVGNGVNGQYPQITVTPIFVR